MTSTNHEPDGIIECEYEPEPIMEHCPKCGRALDYQFGIGSIAHEHCPGTIATIKDDVRPLGRNHKTYGELVSRAGQYSVDSLTRELIRYFAPTSAQVKRAHKNIYNQCVRDAVAKRMYTASVVYVKSGAPALEQ